MFSNTEALGQLYNLLNVSSAIKNLLMKSIAVMSFGISWTKNNDQNDATDKAQDEIDNKNAAWEHEGTADRKKLNSVQLIFSLRKLILTLLVNWWFQIVVDRIGCF